MLNLKKKKHTPFPINIPLFLFTHRYTTDQQAPPPPRGGAVRSGLRVQFPGPPQSMVNLACLAKVWLRSLTVLTLLQLFKHGWRQSTVDSLKSNWNILLQNDVYVLLKLLFITILNCQESARDISATDVSARTFRPRTFRPRTFRPRKN